MRLIATLLLSLTLSLPALALELTDQNVQKWINSYSAVVEWSQTQDKKDLEFLEQKQSEQTPKFDALFSNAIKDMKGHKIYNDFSGVLKKNGFSDTGEWAQLGDRIMAATMAVEIEKHEASSGQHRAQMKQAMDGLMNNPNLSAEQKAQMQQMMGMSTQVLDVADKVPAKDKEVIRRNADQIKQVMEKHARQQTGQN